MNRTNTILIIEDHLESLSLYGEILRDENYNIIETTHGQEALSYLQDHEEMPDLIIMDLTFPHMSAEEFVQKLKVDAKWALIPIFVISGQIETQARALKANSYMMKPFELDGFISKISQFMSKSYG